MKDDYKTTYHYLTDLENRLSKRYDVPQTLLDHLTKAREVMADGLELSLFNWRSVIPLYEAGIPTDEIQKLVRVQDYYYVDYPIDKKLPPESKRPTQALVWDDPKYKAIDIQIKEIIKYYESLKTHLRHEFSSGVTGMQVAVNLRSGEFIPDKTNPEEATWDQDRHCSWDNDYFRLSKEETRKGIEQSALMYDEFIDDNHEGECGTPVSI